jgi:hypothetical protein
MAQQALACARGLSHARSFTAARARRHTSVRQVTAVAGTARPYGKYEGRAPMGEDEHDAGASTHGANHPSVSLRLVTPDGERLCAGEDFNLHRWPPVPCAKYFDDRAWTAVESFAARVVRGEACVSSLGRDDDLEPAGVCPGRGVNQDGTRIETLPMYTKCQRKRRTNLRVHLAYYGPAFTGWAWTPQHDEAYTADETVQWAAGRTLRHRVDPTRPETLTHGRQGTADLQRGADGQGRQRRGAVLQRLVQLESLHRRRR